jgi:predicted RNase H-related nuclease YkuK (DUF458 family)
VTVHARIDLEEVRSFLAHQPETTKVYLGCDSERILIRDQWYAEFTLAIVVHINARNGCKIFGEVQRERDFDKSRRSPRLRLMTEVYKVAELYLKLSDVLENRQVEVHLDINPNQMYGSSCVVDEAIGYIRGVCNVLPMIKPRAFAATYCADRLKEILDLRAKAA